MQGALEGVETDFYAGNPFSRLDERDDLEFYQQPRMVHHIDATARARISDIYGRSLKPGMHVLDLMSSWTSHLPDDLHGLSVVGLGMNAEEMKANPRLCSHVVHDLNRDPVLPFSENLFDAAICTVSVEYMTRPIEAMRDLARVLKPAAPLVVTWSERWFPPKVVQVWTELHPFERMGLVIDYFVRSGGFDDIETETIRGLPRPSNDKYANMVPFSDPVYAVWGRCSTHR
jgi:SAM-dependent methyltransferase